MARAGILYSHVAQAAAQLAAADKTPTVDSVREALGGTGSKSTIAPLLKRWKADQQDTIIAVDSGLPAPLLQAVKGLHQHMQAEFAQQLDQAKQQHAAELHAAAEHEQQLRTELQYGLKANAILTENLAQTRQALAQLQAAHQAQSLTLAAIQAENAGLQQRLKDRATEVATLDHQLTQARAQFEHYQDATGAQRAQERQMYDQRIARIEQDLASVNQKNAVQQTTIVQQEACITQLTTEQERYEKALQAAQDELVDVRAARDRLVDRMDEATATKEGLTVQLATAQQQLSDIRVVLATREHAMTMLAEQVRRTEERTDRLAEEKNIWLQQRGALEHRALSAEQQVATLTGAATKP